MTFLVMASAGLLTLYFLIQAGLNVVVLLINVVFIGATTTATSQILLSPLFAHVCPSYLHHKTVPVPILSLRGEDAKTAQTIERSVDKSDSYQAQSSPEDDSGIEVPKLLAYVSALAISTTWFFMRKQEWMWLLQDALSANVCILFVRTIRLPSLRLATLFLGLSALRSS